MSSSISDIIAALNTGSLWVNRMGSLLLIVFGTFGNVFNIIIFTRPALRTNSCAFYFLAGSVNNLFAIYTAYLHRFLLYMWNLDATRWSNVLCKLRNFFTYPALELLLWFVVLASIDRFFSSSKSVRLRQLSSLPTARKVVAVFVLLMYLTHVHIFFVFYVTEKGCDSPSPEYSIIFFIFFAFFSAIIPFVLLAIFGVLTFRNVLQVRRQVGAHDDNPAQGRLRSSDRQMLAMLLVQLLLCILLTAPFAAINLYMTFFTYILGYKRQPYDDAIFNFSFNFARILYCFDGVIGFYVYTLTGTKFRMEFKRCTRHGLAMVLTATHLLPCLPLTVQQVLLNENRTDFRNRLTSRLEARRTTGQQPVLITNST